MTRASIQGLKRSAIDLRRVQFEVETHAKLVKTGGDATQECKKFRTSFGNFRSMPAYVGVLTVR